MLNYSLPYNILLQYHNTAHHTNTSREDITYREISVIFKKILQTSVLLIHSSILYRKCPIADIKIHCKI